MRVTLPVKRPWLQILRSQLCRLLCRSNDVVPGQPAVKDDGHQRYAEPGGTLKPEGRTDAARHQQPALLAGTGGLWASACEVHAKSHPRQPTPPPRKGSTHVSISTSPHRQEPPPGPPGPDRGPAPRTSNTMTGHERQQMRKAITTAIAVTAVSPLLLLELPNRRMPPPVASEQVHRACGRQHDVYQRRRADLRVRHLHLLGNDRRQHRVQVLSVMSASWARVISNPSDGATGFI